LYSAAPAGPCIENNPAVASTAAILMGIETS
jgi:hypothetical protein